MTWTRRGVLGALGVTAGGVLRGPRLAAASAPTRPRKLIQIALRGGIDAILTTDPKVRGEVDARIEVPYTKDRIIEVGAHRIGPNFADLASYVPSMAILNTVDNGTVSHLTAFQRLACFRKTFVVRRGLTHTLHSALGEQLATKQPLHEVWLQTNLGPKYIPSSPSLVVNTWPVGKPTMLERLWFAANEAPNYDVLVRAAQDELASCHANESELACSSMASTLALFERLHGLPRPAPFTPLALTSTDKRNVAETVTLAGHEWAAITRDLVYMLQHDLVTSLFVLAPHGYWDSHEYNAQNQAKCSMVFAAGFKHLMQALETTTTSDGATLAAQTGLVIASELGRFPILNSSLGKDHYPQHPFIFMGPGIRPGQYGASDRLMTARPISETTGVPGGSGNRIPTIEDVGATIFHWFGFDPAGAGYRGRPLPFLFV